jgi:two-component system nitrate/nitrite response regulator NarL
MSGSILVVDDDPEFIVLARRILQSLGLLVTGEARTAAAAIDAAESLRPDAALVDVGLPDGDGLTLARHLTSLPWGLRVVLTSSDPDAASARDVCRSGARAFVPKQDLLDAPLGRLLAVD